MVKRQCSGLRKEVSSPTWVALGENHLLRTILCRNWELVLKRGGEIGRGSPHRSVSSPRAWLIPHVWSALSSRAPIPALPSSLDVTL